MSKKKLAAGVAVLAVLGGSLAAYAYFTASGQGTGSASVGSSTAFVVAQTTISNGPLTPGGPTETIGFTVTNASSGHQQLSAVSIQVAGSTGTSPNATPTVYSFPATANGNPSCTAADFSVGGATAGTTYTENISTAGAGLPVDLAPGAVYTGTVTVQMVDRTDSVAGNNSGNQNNCQNQQPPLFYSAS